MKRYIIKLTTILLFLTVFSSCKKIELEPIFPSDNIIAFFEEYFPPPASGFYQPGCFLIVDGERENKCIAINSMDEFRKNFCCLPTLLPYIDFKSYTLIIGKHEMVASNFKVIEQNIIVWSNKIVLNLRTQVPTSFYPSTCMLYYWGIYSKLDNKPIIVKVSDGEYIRK